MKTNKVWEKGVTLPFFCLVDLNYYKDKKKQEKGKREKKKRRGEKNECDTRSSAQVSFWFPSDPCRC